MIHYARNEFYLSGREKGFEANNRQTLLQIEKTTGEPQKELVTSRNPPKPFLYVWQWFLEMQTGLPLTFQELKAWGELKQIELKKIEIEILTKLTRLSNE